LAVLKRDPILVLIDVGGSILYRASDRLDLGKDRRVTGKEYCQIKMHHHYYRPHFE